MTLSRPLFAAALLMSVAALGLSPAIAQNAPAAANSDTMQGQVRHHARSRMIPGQLVDGRIAFLKAELKITPDQEGQWQQLATAMRQNANAFDEAISSTRQQHGTMDAIQRLTVREQFDQVRTANDARLLAAFKPLYASLSPEQQNIANQLVAAHHEWHRHA